MNKGKPDSGLFREDGTPLPQKYTNDEIMKMFEDLAEYDPGYPIDSILVDDDKEQSNANTRNAHRN